MDTLLREIARIERWSQSRLEALLDQRRRMAPINVVAALQRLREVHQDVLHGKPCPDIRLCQLRLIEGGKR